jgi:hypothetical protein
MLRSNRFAEILATVIMSYLAILGWIQLQQEQHFQLELGNHSEVRSTHISTRSFRQEYF